MEKYINMIKQMEKKKTYTIDELMISEFLYKVEGKMEIYWAPFDFINKQAKVVLLGITPGWTQMHNSFVYTINHIEHEELNECMRNAKRYASFSGPIRKFLVEMLDGIGLNKYLKIDNCESLFGEHNHLVHTTSILRYPVFINHKNYTGSQPPLYKNKCLMEVVNNLFIEEMNQLHEDILIIPMGKAVSNTLNCLVEQNQLKQSNILFDFPHPSGANAHRKKQFDSIKEQFIKVIKTIDK